MGFLDPVVEAVPGLPDTFVRVLTGEQLAQIMPQMTETENDPSTAPLLFALLCAMTLCDESGTRLYIDSDADKIAADAPFNRVKICGEHCLEISGLGNDSGN